MRTPSSCCSDVCSAYGALAKTVLNLPPIVEMLEKGKVSGVDRTSSLCSWALSKLDPCEFIVAYGSSMPGLFACTDIHKHTTVGF